MSEKGGSRVEQAKAHARAFVIEKLDGDEAALEAIDGAAEGGEIRRMRLGQILRSAKSMIAESDLSIGEIRAFGEAQMGGADRAQLDPGAAVGLIVALTVASIVAAFLLPIGVTELAGADLGNNASDGAVALWNILDVIIILALFLFFVGIAISAT